MLDSAWLKGHIDEILAVVVVVGVLLTVHEVEEPRAMNLLEKNVPNWIISWFDYSEPSNS